MTELNSQTGFLQAQGAPLYYEVAGEGEPLLLIHAGIADSRMWDEQFAVFARHYRVIRYDQRGYGQSQYPAGPFAYHEDPVELLTSLGIESAHVVGISFGGLVALDFVLSHPQMVRSLVLVAPSVSGTQPSEAVKRFQEEEEAYLERDDLDAASDLNVRVWVDGPRRTPEQVDASVRERVRAMQRHAFTVPVPDGAELVKLQPPAIERLAEVRVPTLIVVGDYDLPDKLELSQLLASRINGAQLLVIEGVAHMVSMERPEQFNQAVLSFLSRVSGADV
ncbi:alpha/beta fold hydrolase [Dictyobacter aurantiacus]|uniref:Hydrolase n=1 Tax=Dictyobacter aurantiacus TaxID=1936993 RepID=A0A401ZKR1_9CHLR|nr:alpha/beta hydrolase [Dictyobacter aurantiacus]GCE07436.1 hydrolase [Dictyobacter aurantiacus]